MPILGCFGTFTDFYLKQKIPPFIEGNLCVCAVNYGVCVFAYTIS